MRHSATTRSSTRRQTSSEPEHAPAPDIPPFNRATCASTFVQIAEGLGVLGAGFKPDDVLKLRNQLLGDASDGLTWGDMTADLWQTLILNLRDMAAKS